MNFEKFDSKEHSVNQVADLIYDIDHWTFDSLYKNKESAVKDISRDLLNHDHDDLYVIVCKGEIIGIIVLWINKRPSFIQYLKEFTSFKLLAIDILDYFVISDVNEDEIYIAELGISSKCRGKGIGSKVISKVIEKASEDNFKKVKLDADFRNTGAKRLYEKLGFKVFNKKEIFKRGMYNLEYDL